jgi:hypothetical protein
MRPILYTGTLLIAAGACTGIVEAPDEGSGSTGVAVCSSNAFWKDKDMGSEFMHPGGKCNECHNKNLTAPNFTIAGTVYPTMHEPDDCHGVNGSSIDGGGMSEVQIVIVDGTGRALQPPLAVNSVGNFRYEIPVIPPFRVKVVTKSGKESKMTMSPPHGDCNACHTQTGANLAPGRITIEL